MARHVEVEPALWEEFHRVVNMSSRELPDQAGTPTGRRVLHILQKRRVDLDAEDVAVMRKVVERSHAERRDELEPSAGQDNWRHRLMTLGHDPLKRT